jgi:hypothetical protein
MINTTVLFELVQIEGVSMTFDLVTKRCPNLLILDKTLKQKKAHISYDLRALIQYIMPPIDTYVTDIIKKIKTFENYTSFIPL